MLYSCLICPMRSTGPVVVAGIATILPRRPVGDHRRRKIATVRKEALTDNPAEAVDVAFAAAERSAGNQIGQRRRRRGTARSVPFRRIEAPDANSRFRGADPERVAVDNSGHVSSERLAVIRLLACASALVDADPGVAGLGSDSGIEGHCGQNRHECRCRQPVGDPAAGIAPSGSGADAPHPNVWLRRRCQRASSSYRVAVSRSARLRWRRSASCATSR